MSFRVKISLILVVLLTLLLSNSLIIHHLEKQAKHHQDSIRHAKQVLIHEQKLLSAMKDAETGQRGYLLTLNSNYLQPYFSGIKEANNELLLLSHQVHNEQQKETLKKIKSLISQKNAELAQTIQLAQSNQLDTALQIVRTNKGKEYMDKLRAQLFAFAAQEQAFMQRQTLSYQAQKNRIDNLISAEAIIAALLVVFTWFYLNRYLFTPLKTLISDVESIRAGNQPQPRNITRKDEIGKLMAAFYAMSDQIQTREDSLKYKAHYDELTGLRNRSTLHPLINRALSGTTFNESKAALLLIDLDRFKQINDTYGHATGDAVLTESAKRLESAVRTGDSVFRIGGDEFVILLASLKHSNNAELIASNIAAMFEDPVFFHNQVIQLEISIGIALAPDHATQAEDLLRKADIAMYAAKHACGTGYRIYQNGSQLPQQNNRLETEA